MPLYYTLLCLHILGACIWVGGHLVLATRILPRALREKKAALIREFEQGYERIGMPALAVQIGTGLWLAHRLLGGSAAVWWGDSSLARVVQVKLALLAATAALALHAKLRVIPRLRDDNLPLMGAHIVGVTTFGVLFALAGASLRLGGYPVFAP
ncbi:MAG: CopD family protein [Lacunisphaera sp.]|jgi:putative copper export protein|nr:CopD family protein [Lacunisphaera sp.]